MRNPPGQPSKFTQENKEKLLTAIRKGAPYELACDYAGIVYNTFLNWKKIADQIQDPEYIQFFQDLKEAQGHTALVWLDKIDKAMQDGAWQAASWKLERRHAKYFSVAGGLMELNERLEKLEDLTKSKGEQSEEGNGT